MGHEAHVDHPDEVSWYVGHGPAPILGPCPHTTCQHNGWSTVAWGPDLRHYELVVCDDREGCAGRCRGWVAQEEGSNARGVLWGLQAFDSTREHLTTREERRATDVRIAAAREARHAAAAEARRAGASR